MKNILKKLSPKSESDKSERLEDQIRQLAEEQAKDYAILESIGEGLLVTDEQKKITIANRQAADMLGRGIDELIGGKWFEVIPIYDIGGSLVRNEERPMQKALSTGEKVATDAYFYARKNGVKFPVAITASPVVLDGKIIGAVEVFRDITKEKEIERAKTQFVSLASHQLRTPLTSTKWLIEILMEENLTKEQKEKIKNLFLANERLITLVNDLLDVSRVESGRVDYHQEEVNLIDLINREVELLKLPAEKSGKKIIFSKKDSRATVKTDPILFDEAFKNILDNAVTYSPEGSDIYVRLEKDGDNYLVSVNNQGPLIPEGDKHKIFSRFYRSEEGRKIKPEGSGLGLFIAKSAVETLGGKIWFESSEKKGVTFSMSIPVK